MTMIHTHGTNKNFMGTRSPLDQLVVVPRYLARCLGNKIFRRHYVMRFYVSRDLLNFNCSLPNGLCHGILTIRYNTKEIFE